MEWEHYKYQLYILELLSMADKKKQHFIPRFYLKYFSCESKGKAINIFNIPSSRFIVNGNLKNQAYKNYFYGKDCKVENVLGEIEAIGSIIIKNIVLNNSITTQLKSIIDRINLLLFIFSLEARTVYSKDLSNELYDKLFKAVMSHNSRISSNDLDKISISSKYSHLQSISQSAASLHLVLDLDFKLIINETNMPFIISDNPVVRYNQFLESRKIFGGNVGLVCKGLEIFFPISPKHLLIFYDKDTYKIGAKKKSTLIINSDKDIKSLNILQYINANENLYFNQNISKTDIDKIVRKSIQYQRTSKYNVDEFTISENDKEKRILLHNYQSDVKCNLSLSFINILKKAKEYNLGDKVLHVRDEEMLNLDIDFRKLVEEGRYKEWEFFQFLKDIR